MLIASQNCATITNNFKAFWSLPKETWMHEFKSSLSSWTPNIWELLLYFFSTDLSILDILLKTIKECLMPGFLHLTWYCQGPFVFQHVPAFYSFDGWKCFIIWMCHFLFYIDSSADESLSLHFFFLIMTVNIHLWAALFSLLWGVYWVVDFLGQTVVNAHLGNCQTIVQRSYITLHSFFN